MAVVGVNNPPKSIGSTRLRQVKMFRDFSASEQSIEKQINKWLSDNAGKIDVIDIQYSSFVRSERGTWLEWTAMVVYDVK
ncbi:MAG: hypothetical protein MJZ30_13160 [Paludibacteraceae bacterium]|nr:hypothetical protein [Paludibacteraceae bacterium]